MKVEIWSDVVCPWCFIGKRNFEAALARFDHAGDVEVVWRSFELDPNAPPTREGDYAGRLARKYGVPRDQAQAMIDRMAATGAAAGVDFRFDISKPGNTFDAHRLLHLAEDHGVQDAFKERLFQATFSEGAPVSDHATLERLALEVGLQPEDVDRVLSSDAYVDEVREDEAQAASYGIGGVPFFVIDRTYAVSGAQPPDALLRVLEHAWTEGHKKLEVLVPDGDSNAACEGDACEF